MGRVTLESRMELRLFSVCMIPSVKEIYFLDGDWVIQHMLWNWAKPGSVTSLQHFKVKALIIYSV